MQHDDQLLIGEEKESLSERYFGLPTHKFLLASGIVLVVGVYMGFIFFGNNSLSVLLDLEEHQDYLSEDIERLKAENAALQKQYFELKELDADSQ
ncbi:MULTISPECIES: hypothetical protein [unclassified Sulfuricurvum]|uniref:hypothetical protein n=1 Tax=unclassified Sulfuricurvum TaxID=2632390 RepID=UPI0002996E45|nr:MULTISPECIES: hypothetical protein [unclassified Sulfuricurvum]AFV96390.1 hypothetical protein B649_00380 [Candidatus Sulfuricurvum sp. RIFRC-1]HBM35720.1 hypothetical protein [Sulfuricurvum sp.]